MQKAKKTGRRYVELRRREKQKEKGTPTDTKTTFSFTPIFSKYLVQHDQSSNQQNSSTANVNHGQASSDQAEGLENMKRMMEGSAIRNINQTDASGDGVIGGIQNTKSLSELEELCNRSSNNKLLKIRIICYVMR